MNRRGLLFGLGAALAAPAIVRVEAIMPVKAIPEALASVPLEEALSAWTEPRRIKFLVRIRSENGHLCEWMALPDALDGGETHV